MVSLEPSDESLSLLQHRHHRAATTSQITPSNTPHTTDTTAAITHPTDTLSPLHHLKKYGNMYLEMVEKRPLVTKSITATYYSRRRRLVCTRLGTCSSRRDCRRWCGLATSRTICTVWILWSSVESLLFSCTRYLSSSDTTTRTTTLLFSHYSTQSVY